MPLPYHNRTQAARELAASLRPYAGRTDVLVLALPRGGVPIAYEIATALGASLELLLVRKLGLPGRAELAMGAIASGDICVLNPGVVEGLAVPPEVVDRVIETEQRELHRREQAYRGQRPVPDLEGQCVILVDDGLATGATMRAAIAAVHQQKPARLVVAVPVAPPLTVAALRQEVDEIICPATPEAFSGISQWYEDFAQVNDAEVRALLEQAWRRQEQTSRPAASCHTQG